MIYGLERGFNVDRAEQPPTVLSFCTGYGGIELGLERVFGGITPLAHVEIEAFAIANLVNKMETGRMAPAPIWTDIKTLNAGIFRGCVDILTGGYPCQPFSSAGKRLGTDDPRHLWPWIKDHIRAIQPGWVFLENVEGHLSKGVAEVLADLEEMAYTVKCGVFSAVEAGAPHQRKRVFILAHSSESGLKAFGGESLRKRGAGTPCERSCIPCRDRWPARPGERQHEWEEPRTVGHTGRVRQEVGEIQTAGTEQPGSPGEQTGQAQRQVGRAANGATRRVDELRLLGNGVVPATAAKAFLTLYKQLTETGARFDRT